MTPTIATWSCFENGSPGFLGSIIRGNESNGWIDIRKFTHTWGGGIYTSYWGIIYIAGKSGALRSGSAPLGIKLSSDWYPRALMYCFQKAFISGLGNLIWAEQEESGWAYCTLWSRRLHVGVVQLAGLVVDPPGSMSRGQGVSSGAVPTPPTVVR